MFFNSLFFEKILILFDKIFKKQPYSVEIKTIQNFLDKMPKQLYFICVKAGEQKILMKMPFQLFLKTAFLLHVNFLHIENW
jgi:hypothetical protein